MKFEFSLHPIDKVSGDFVVVFAYQGKKSYLPTTPFSYIDKKLDGLLSNELKSDSYMGKEGEIHLFSTHSKIVGSKAVVVGLGKREEFKEEKMRKALAQLSHKMRGKVNSYVISPLSKIDSDVAVRRQVQLLSEGVLFGSYSFSNYKKRPEQFRELEVVIFSNKDKGDVTLMKKGARDAENVYRGVRVARDLVNEQSATATPEHLAKMAKDIARASKNVTCKVYDSAQIEKMGMEAFLGVARASLSDVPPKFIYLHYKPKKRTTKKVAIVGKGITFDTGGVSLKPANYMTNMKCDMSGAAAVLGLFSVIDDVQPSVEVMGLIAATPNVVSSKAYVPGDILRAMNGKTIEVLNTDAEGRITLADALSYAVKQGADEIIDLATLTGACVVALGDDYAGLFTNNDTLATKVKEASNESGERVWELPMPDEYKKLIESPVADVANIGSTPYGGAITAALFLQEFVEETPWVHLDIAGPAFYEKDFAYGNKGGSGYGVSTLISFLKHS